MNIFKKLETFAYRSIIVPLQGRKTFDFVKDHYTSGMKTLDFGCGTGNNSQLFDAADYVGAEVDISRVNNSREKYPQKTFEQIPIINSDNDSLPWKDKTFDLVFVSLCLHHINADTCKLIFKEFRRILKRKGKIIGIEPCLIKKNYINNIYMNILDVGDYILSANKYKKLYLSESFETNHINIIKTFGYNLWQYTSEPINNKSIPYKGGRTIYRKFTKPFHLLGLYGKWIALIFIIYTIINFLVNIISGT